MLRIAINFLWPSFLVAIVADGIFFSLLEPDELLRMAGYCEASSIAVYTITFFFFWAACSMASSLTYYMAYFVKNKG